MVVTYLWIICTHGEPCCPSVILKLYKNKSQALVDEMELYEDLEEYEYEEFDFEGIVDSANDAE